MTPRNCLSSLFFRHFPSLWVNLSKKDRRRALMYTLQYLFRYIGSSELSVALHGLLGSVSLEEFRYELTHKERDILTLKTWIFNNDRRSLQDVPEDFAKRNHLLKNLILEDESFSCYLDSLRLNYKFRSYSRIHQFIDERWKDALTFTRKFIYRKHRFLIQNNSVVKEELEIDLMLEGIRAIVLMYPKIHSYKHMFSIWKRAIHNSGINVISKYTTKSRQSILQFNNEFKGRIYSYESLIEEKGEKEVGFISAEDSFERDVAFKHLLLKIAPTVKRKRAVYLLMGEYDEEFSSYIKNKGYTIKENDAWFSMSRIVQYKKAVREFLKFSSRKFDRFIESIKEVILSFKMENKLEYGI